MLRGFGKVNLKHMRFRNFHSNIPCIVLMSHSDVRTQYWKPDHNSHLIRVIITMPFSILLLSGVMWDRFWSFCLRVWQIRGAFLSKFDGE